MAKVEMIAETDFTEHWRRVFEEVGMDTSPDCTMAESLIEFAGRNCYQSWSNPGKKTNADYIKNIIEHGHGSVLEHASVTFFITGVSRSLTHELVRHRHLSFSELSQRYVNMDDWSLVVPPAVDGESMGGLHHEVTFRYQDLVKDLESRDLTRKQIREAARCVMPNCTETRIVVTGNLRAWRAFIDARANEHADAEICALAVEIATQLKDRFPNVFQDYTIQASAVSGLETGSSGASQATSRIEGGYAFTHWRKV